MRSRGLLPLLVMSMVAAACSGDDGGLFETVPSTAATTTTTVPATVATTPPTTAVPVTTTTLPPTTTAPAGRVLVSIPVGPGGIEYRGGADDLERVGPSQLAVDPAGGIHIFDPVALRVLSFTAAGESSVDLGELDILGVSGLAAAGDHLIVVEIVFGPVRNLVHRVSFDGVILETFDLAPGVRLDDGFSGVRAGPAGEIIIELAGGQSYGVWNGATYDIADGLDLDGLQVAARPPDLIVDGNLITADLVGNFGALRYLATGSDGVHAVIREDVLQTDPLFVVLTTVEWYDDGRFVLAAGVPTLQEQAIDAPPGIALMPDGRAVALVAGETAVEVIMLPTTANRILSPED